MKVTVTVERESEDGSSTVSAQWSDHLEMNSLQDFLRGFLVMLGKDGSRLKLEYDHAVPASP